MPVHLNSVTGCTAHRNLVTFVPRALCTDPWSWRLTSWKKIFDREPHVPHTHIVFAFQISRECIKFSRAQLLSRMVPGKSQGFLSFFIPPQTCNVEKHIRMTKWAGSPCLAWSHTLGCFCDVLPCFYQDLLNFLFRRIWHWHIQWQ